MRLSLSLLLAALISLATLGTPVFANESEPSAMAEPQNSVTNTEQGAPAKPGEHVDKEFGPKPRFEANQEGGHFVQAVHFPPPLPIYEDMDKSVGEQLSNRIGMEPLNLVASLIFLMAILHTFAASRFTHIAHVAAEEHAKKLRAENQPVRYHGEVVDKVSFKAEIFHFLGEVEAVFGIWVLALFFAMVYFKGFQAPIEYISNVNYTEPMFVVVIMALAATRPISQLAEKGLAVFAKLLGGKTAAWWLTILTIGPIMGSFITEPGAMTISAMLLAKQFYNKKPSSKFKYATIGLLFVNISVGGTITHFAAPPVLMVAGPWGWDMAHMATFFGWKAVVGIMINNAIYFMIFRWEFKKLDSPQATAIDETEKTLNWNLREDPVPVWIMLVHVAFMVWTVFNAHHPPLFIGAFLFYIGFHQATGHHQNRLDLKPALLVGFFLAGLVTHGGLQAWWIQPVLSSLGELPLMLGATVLTAFNDNAAITYLATLVPNFSDTMKYAVVAGAVTGGGLTVIANAPNPAGQSILNKYFPDGVVPLYLALAALLPTIVVGSAFMLL
ncbi:MAG: putative Na+/H+ antiporter [bacterium]|nr:putative Na+/H+ antiporter [bacterium]